MKKLFFFIFIIINVFNNGVADNISKKNELNKLFNQLKNTKNLAIAEIIESKIWKIWSEHPTKDNLTKSLANATDLMNNGQFQMAFLAFSNIIEQDDGWAEGWNKRATVLFLMNQYEASLKDIEKVLIREPRHFGALSGRALIYIKLEQYEKALKNYKDVQKIYPAMDAAKKMISQLKELINKNAI